MPAGEDAQHIGRGGMAGEVAGGVRQQEIDLLRKGSRFEGGRRYRGVGGADNGPAVPGDREQHPPIVGMRHHDGAVAGEKRAVQHEMHTLAGGDERPRFRVYHPAYTVDERAGGVDHHPALYAEFTIAFNVPRQHPRYQTAFHEDAGRLQVVEGDPVQVRQGQGQTDRQARVVELAVMVHHPAAQAVRLHGRDVTQGLLP